MRITLRGRPDSRLVGTVTAATADSIVVRPATGTAPIAMPPRAIERLEVSVARRSGGERFISGMGWGVLVGGLTGVIAGFASGDDPPGILSFTAGQKAALLGLGLGTIGAVAGGLVGVAGGADVWRQAPPPYVAVSVQTGLSAFHPRIRY